MNVKRAILSVLGRDALKGVVDELEIEVDDRRSVEALRAAVSRARRATPEALVERLYEQDAKDVCELLGLSTKGRYRLLVERILAYANGRGEAPSAGHAPPPTTSTPPTPPPPMSQTGDYRHPEASSPMRPDVGTQAQFRKKQPPKTYRYDSSLSPALEWDGQNPAREAGEALLAEIQAFAASLATRSSSDDASASQASAAKLQEAVARLRNLSRPFLNWAGKAERLSFDVPTLPLFVHERLSTKAIIDTLSGHRRGRDQAQQAMLFDLFADPAHPITDQVLRAYEHRDRWVNRMILGDSLVVMHSLLAYEGLGGAVQMIYIDPPYGVKFGSNFQPFIRKRDVKHNDDEDFTREPEMVQAYRDTWEVGLHSYLTHLRDRLLVARDLLAPSGSVFVQIGDENVHHVREVAEEVFGTENAVALIAFKKTAGQTSRHMAQTCDYLIWFAKDIERLKYQPLFRTRSHGDDDAYCYVELPDKSRRRMTREEMKEASLLPHGSRPYRLQLLQSQRQGRPSGPGSAMYFGVKYGGREFFPSGNRGWTTTESGMQGLAQGRRLEVQGNSLSYVRYLSDYPVVELMSLWDDTQSGSGMDKLYVVQTNVEVVRRCILMTTDPGDLVLDPTCGSGTTAYVAEQWGRRWITCDVSRVPLALARQRILTATFPWYELRDDARGPAGGFIYKRKQNKKGEEVGGIVPHVTLKSIANNEPPAEEVLVDRPEEVKKVTRVSGPFSFEATIPTPVDWEEAPSSDAEPARVASERGESSAHGEYVDRMLEVLRKSPLLRLEGNRTVTLAQIRPPAKTLSLSAEALVETSSFAALACDASASQVPVAFVFGPENGAVSEKLVYEAAKEANAKSYTHLYVIGFAIQPKAREFVDQCDRAAGIAATYVQATPDLMMGDLLKNMRSSQIFSVCGLPEIKIRKLAASLATRETRASQANAANMYQVELLGLDVFDPVTMEVDKRAGDDVPAWFLDTDYNDLCFHVSQAFFPRTSAWDNLRKTLRGTHDDSVWDHLAGATSAPFEAGEHKKIAVKVIDDRGNELMVVKELP